MRFNLPIPYVPVSEERKAELEKSLRHANLLVQEHARKSGVDCDFFREQVLSNSVEVSPQDAETIRVAKEMEWEILCAFSNLIAKVVNRWAAKTCDSSLSHEDLANEALARAVKAVRGFTQDGIKFCTFLHICVNRRLSELCVKSGTVSRIPRSVARMKMQYMTLANEEGSTFDSVVQKMGLSQKRVAELIFALKGVSGDLDYDRDMRIVDESDELREDLDGDKPGIMSVLGSLELSELEKAVLEGFLRSEGKMGLSEVSKKLINPNTKKPYSRMAFSLAWARVKEKIVKAYSEAA
jgi:DNA-directed RNA polymerase specialized sigma24 family protein